MESLQALGLQMYNQSLTAVTAAPIGLNFLQIWLNIKGFLG